MRCDGAAAWDHGQLGLDYIAPLFLGVERRMK